MLVSRYDRTVVTGREFSYVRRVHQEDFCQALGRFTREKYEKEGGPGWKECFALTSLMRDPISATDDRLARAVYQSLVGNPDATAKNYSVVHRGSGTRAHRKLAAMQNR